jgi:septum formation protein
MTTLLIGSLNRIGTDAHLILASQSPRRVEILDMMGLAGKFTQIPSPLDEEALQVELATQTISPEDYAKILAERKAEALGLHLKNTSDGVPEVPTFILGSDTIVDLEG